MWAAQPSFTSKGRAVTVPQLQSQYNNTTVGTMGHTVLQGSGLQTAALKVFFFLSQKYPKTSNKLFYLKNN